MQQLIVRPAITAIISSVLWIATYLLAGTWRILEIKPDENILGFFIGGMVFVDAGIAAAILAKVWLEWIEVRNSLRAETDEERDEKTFSKYADERLPVTIKAAIVILFVLLLGGFFLAPISSPILGVFVTFAITFGLVFYWEVLLDFDDYWSGVWNVDIRDVPDNWKWAKKNKKRVMQGLGYN